MLAARASGNRVYSARKRETDGPLPLLPFFPVVNLDVTAGAAAAVLLKPGSGHG